MAKFALPLLGSGVLQTLNNSVNAVWVGRFLGEEALTATSNGNVLLFVLMGAVFGISMAATILTSQAIGAGNWGQAKRVVGTGVTFFFCLMGLASIAGSVLTPQVLDLMGTPEDARPFAIAYLRVSFLALPFTSLFTLLVGLERAAGNGRTPFYFQAFSVALDILFNPLLIFGVGPLPELGIAGSATSSFLAQVIGFFAMLYYLYRIKSPLRLMRSELHLLRPDPALLRALIFKGLPMGAQILVVASSTLALLSFVNRFGSETTAAYGTAAQLWTYVQMPTVALSGALSVMVAQNIGAKNWGRVAQGVRAAIFLTLAATGTVAALTYAAGPVLFALFLPAGSPAIALAQHINTIVAWSFALLGITFVLFGAMRAAGAVSVPLVISILSLWMARIPFVAAMIPHWGAEAIWWSLPLGSALSATLAFAYYSSGVWRRARMLPPPASPPELAERPA